MTPPLIPIDEARRLYALHRLQILDTDAEPAFDHITALAQQLFDVPIALISFIDKDRQWFKSRIGLDAKETPRNISFCGHTILNDHILLVNNAHEDERFRDNPLVLGVPRIKFYAGAPLHAPGGERIGTLCIIDTRARDFSEAELEPLTALAGIIDDMLCRFDDVLRTAYYDILTGMPNKQLLQDKLNQIIAGSEDINRSLAVCAISIDQLRTLTQSLGCAVGDEFIKAIARKLSKLIGTAAIIGRSANDEFIVLPMQQHDHNSIENFAANILGELSSPIHINGIEISTPISMGVSFFPEHGRIATTLLAAADVALFKARDDGGNTFSIYSQDALIEPDSRMRLYNDLRQALAHDEFELHYQSEIDIASGEIAGVEALLRWNHPRLGLLRPADFLDVAEASGLIIPIGKWVLETACREAQAWRASGILSQAIAVNISVIQFKRSDFVEMVSDALQSTQLPPAYLELELTEAMLTGDNEQTLERIQQLHALGVKLTLDEFGSGYSNLTQLRKFAFRKLKVDQAYIRRMEKSSDDGALIKAIIELAHSLKLTVAGNGVETVAQLEQLRALGCHSAQGALFSKPSCASAMHSMLHSSHTHRHNAHQTGTSQNEIFGLAVKF